MTNEPRTRRNTHENKFEELTGLRIEDVYSSKAYNPKQRHIGLRNGLIFHINRIAKDRILAEELADEVLTRVIFEKLDTFDPMLANFPTWLFQIGKHEIMAHRNKQRVKSSDQEKFISVDSVDDKGISFADTLDSGDPEAMSASDRDEILNIKHSLVKKAVFSLDEKKSSALAMRLLDGLSYNEITDYTGENLNTIKSRIKQGKQAVINRVHKDFKRIDELMS